MSKKNIFSAFWLLLFLGFSPAKPLFGQAETAENAEKAFQNKNYDQALSLFSESFENGWFTEKMLYRLAWLHEQNRDYPMAAYFLRKINQEFGGKLIEDKIRFLAEKSGGNTLYTSASWDKVYRFRNQYGLLLWLILIISTAMILISILQPRWLKNKFRSVLLTLGIPVFALLFIFQFSTLFLMADQAVIVQKTDFYMGPGYATEKNSNALSPCETVDIVDRQDIWVQIEAGPQRWWVPAFAIKTL